MALSSQEVSKFLPSYLPQNRIPIAIQNVLKSIDPLQGHVIGWIFVLAQEFQRLALWKEIPGFRFVTYGLADPKWEGVEFAVLAYARRMTNVSDKPREITVDERVFHVFIRRPFENYHYPIVHPSNGRSACWAASPKVSQQAVLTAKHVLSSILQHDPQIGDKVPMKRGASTIQGTVVDLGPDGIDAALVEPPNSSSILTGNAINPLTFVTPWMDVIINAAAGPINTKVTSVTDTRGILRSSLLPARVILADAGFPGDSGSLVNDPQGNGIGIYIGELTDPACRTEGISQHLGQVVDLMQLQLND